MLPDGFVSGMLSGDIFGFAVCGEEDCELCSLVDEDEEGDESFCLDCGKVSNGLA